MKIQVMLGAFLFTGFLSVQAAPQSAASPASACYGSLAAQLTEAQKVERLINFIRGMEGATFIRNGSEHDPKEAADHLQSKWEKHKSNINTAKEFIAELASASGLTGETYKIRFQDGTTLETREVLLKELERIEQE